MAPLLDQKIEAVLETVQKPSRYIGGEANQVRKPQATRLVALCYPDAYEIGISNQALQILYAQVNAREAFAAERVYCPWPDMADAMRSEGIPLFTLETWRPVREVDMLGITLQAELTYSNVLELHRVTWNGTALVAGARTIVSKGASASHVSTRLGVAVDSAGNILVGWSKGSKETSLATITPANDVHIETVEAQ